MATNDWSYTAPAVDIGTVGTDFSTATTYASASTLYQTKEQTATHIKTSLEKYLFQPLTQAALDNINLELGRITATNDTTLGPTSATYFDQTTNTVHHRWYDSYGTATTEYGIGYRIPYYETIGAGCTYTISDLGLSCYCVPELSKEDKLKEKVRSNLLIKVKSRASLLHDVAPAELVAMETLREELSESEFRKYIKYGFILVKAKSGKTYQVFRNQTHTKVWLGGKLIEEVCIKIQDSQIPRSDNVIAFKTMIEADEEEFLKMGNRYKNLNQQAA